MGVLIVERGDMHVHCLFVTRVLFGHYYMNEGCPYMCISDRIRFAGSELVK